MANYNDDKKILRCSFCNKTQDQVRKLIAGPKAKGVYICDECINVAQHILEEETKEEFQLSETWAQDAQEDLEEWIEEQGIQLRY